MSLTKSELVTKIRNENPDHWSQYSDETVFQAVLRSRPELLDKLKPETKGERLYKKIGPAASAGFGKRFMHQFETQGREMGAGLKGMAPWVSTKDAEHARKYAETIYRRKIAEDTELQAYLAWKEDEPGWTNLHTATRSLSEALPSLSLAIVSTGVGLAAAPLTNGSSLAITAASLIPMFAMEAGTQYVEAMRVMVDEMGMSAEDARGYAGIAAGSYGVVSSLLERMGSKQFLKLVPGLNVKAVEKDLLKSITKSLVKFGADKNFIVRQGARTVAGTAQVLAGALREGPTEWMQSVTQQSINLGLKHGLGEDGVGVLTAMQQNFSKAVTSKEALEEGFAGATTGILGFPGGYVTSVSKTTTSEDIAETQKAYKDMRVKDELRPLLKERGLKSSGNKAELISRLEENDKATTETQQGGSSLLGDFLSAVVSPAEKMGDILTKTKEGTSPIETAIQETEEYTNSGNKLLRIIKDNPDYVDVIAEHESSDTLLQQLRNALNKEMVSGEIPNNRDDIIREAKHFAIKGDIYLPKDDTNVGMLGEEDISSQNPVIVYEPSDAIDVQVDEGPIRTSDVPVDAGFHEDAGPQTAETIVAIRTKDGKVTKVAKTEQPKSKVETKPKTTPSVKSSKKTKPVKGSKKHGPIVEEYKESLSSSSSLEEAVSKYLSLWSDEIKSGRKTAEEVREEAEWHFNYEQEQLQKLEKNPLEYFKNLLKRAKELAAEVEGPESIYPAKNIRMAEAAIAELEGPKAPKTSKTPPKPRKSRKAPVTEPEEDKLTNTELNKKIKELGLENNVPKTKAGKISFSKANKAEIVKQIEIAEQPKAVEEALSGEIGFKEPLKRISLRDIPPDNSKIIMERAQISSQLGESRIRDKFLKEKELELMAQMQSTGMHRLIADAKTKIYGFMGEGIVPDFVEAIQESKKQLIRYAKNSNKDRSKRGEQLFDLDIIAEEMDSVKAFIEKTLSEEGISLDAYKKLSSENRQILFKPRLEDAQTKLGATKDVTTKFLKEAPAKTEVEQATDEEAIVTDSDIEALLEEHGVMSKEDELVDNFQDEGSSEEQLIKHNKTLAEKILKRLKKHFPFIDVKTFEGLINIHGVNRIGFAMEALVAWSTTDGRIDTMPHEFAHIYVKMLRNEPIIKLGIKLFGSEEALVKHIGLYYAKRIQEKSLLNRIKIWLKQFANRLRLKFGKLDKLAKEDVAQIIAEEFYQGRWLGVEAMVGEQFIEFSNDNAVDKEDAERDDDTVNSKQTNIPNDIHITSFLSKVLGIYVDRNEDYPHMIDIAQQAKTFEEYKNNLFDWAEEHVKKPGNEYLGKVRKRTPFTQAEYKFMKEYASRKRHSAEDRRKYKKLKRQEVEHSRHMEQLHNDWLKALVRIRRFSASNPKRQGKDTRVYQEWIVNGDGIVTAGETNKITNKKASETNTMNFVEKQLVDNESESRLFFLPIKEIMYERTNRKTKEVFHVQANFDISDTVINTAQNNHAKKYVRILVNKLSAIRDEAKLGAEKIRDSNLTKKKKEEAFAALRQLIQRKLLGIANSSNLISIIGSKMGDNSAVLSTKTARKDLPANITPSGFVEFIDGEVADEHMTEEHAEAFYEEANIEKLTIHKNPLVDMSLVDYINEQMLNADNRTLDVINNIITHSARAMGLKAAMSQALARYKFWQEIRVKDYLMHENSAADSMTRLSIDLAEGTNPKGVGKAKLMLIGGDVKVKVVVGGKEWDAGVYDDFDGATFTGTRWLAKVAKAYGYKQLHQLKTFIRQKDGDYDYLGMKHMQFNPYKGMRFYKGDTLIAKVEGQGKDTYFIDMNPDSDTYGQKFDMIASSNEAKMAYGKYAKENDGFYKLHDIDEMSVKVTQVKTKTAMAASHPIALGEMLLAIKDSDGNADALIKQIKKRYGEIIGHYMEQLNSFYDNPKLLKDFVNRVRDEENIPTELEEYISLIDDETGVGMFHPVIISHLMPILNSRIFKEGIFKARGWEKKASDVYLKPAAHLKIEKNNVMVSSSNSVAVSQVEQAYLKQKGLKQKNWENNHEKIKDLNEWLDEGNDVHVLIHRNPIAKLTGPMLRRIQRLVEGEHGQNMMLSFQDVKDILDGDWDGDKGVFEFISPGHVDAMQAWQSSDAFADADKVVSLDMYGKRTDKDETLSGTSVGSWRDVMTAIVNNAKTDGATGVMVNAKTVLAQLAHKGFKIFPTSMQDDNGYIEVIDPNEEVVMTYIALDENQLNKKQLAIINNNGDSIVEIDGKKYLKTTKQHELAILFQMAVDAVKYRFWGEIVDESRLSNFEFMLTRVFRRSDGEALTKDQRKLVELAFSTQNVSKRRAGRTDKNYAASFQQNVDSSLELARLIYNEDGKLKSDKDFSEDFLTTMSETSTKIEDIPLKVEMQNKVTPVEELLMGVGKNINESDFYFVFTNKHAKRTAHVLAMNKLMKIATGTKLYSDFISGKKQKDYQQVRDFLNKEDDDGNSFVSIWKDLLASTDNIKDIRMDLTQDFVNFVDKYINSWNKMSASAQAWATLEMLSGFRDDIYILKLPPLKLMDKKIIKRYLPLFEEYLREQPADLSTSKKPAKIRQDAILGHYLDLQGEVFDKYEKIDKKVGVCK